MSYPLIRQMCLGLFIVGTLVHVGGSTANAAKKDKKQKMVVAEVLATSQGQFAVLLKTELAPFRYLPIWVAENDAVVIKMYLDRQKPPRPLTLNLLESVLNSTHVRLLEINLDDVKEGVILGRLILKQNERRIGIDARPSDAIGLALGRDVPIWVKEQILVDVGFSLDSFPTEVPEENTLEAPTDYSETL